MMRRITLSLAGALAVLAITMTAFAQDTTVNSGTVHGTIVAPPSTRGLPGLKVHTSLYVFRPDGILQDAQNPPSTAETPASLACVYGVTAPTNGCPRNGSVLATGGAKAIAVVDFGHNSTLQADFDHFNAQYGLPSQTLHFVCDCGSCPSNDGTGWDLETALDVEYSHAMAPHAQIIVAEFCSDPFEGGQSAAEFKASQAVAAAGGGQVSNSFGYDGGEFADELSWDQFMSTSGVVYFSSSGDSGLGPQYPSVSPNTVSAGGTRIQRDSGGNFTGTESCWSGSGGGISQFEPLPQYQLFVANRTNFKRGTPDWSGDADPSSGAAVYTSTGCNGWCQVGGTSLASPMLAGIVNAGGNFFQNNFTELGKTYQYYVNIGRYHQFFFDVTSGSNGAQASVLWDQCTGLGSPRKSSGF
jgi:subtilase family serine protease